jgi:hypothetical protein
VLSSASVIPPSYCHCHQQWRIHSHFHHHDCSNLWTPGLFLFILSHDMKLNSIPSGYYICPSIRDHAGGIDGGVHLVTNISPICRSFSDVSLVALVPSLQYLPFWCMEEFGCRKIHLGIGDGAGGRPLKRRMRNLMIPQFQSGIQQ